MPKDKIVSINKIGSKNSDEPFHYTGCGLKNIFLENGWHIDADNNLYIEKISELHMAIAEHLVYLSRKLKGSEIKFVRDYMDLPIKELSNLIGETTQDIRALETGKLAINKSTDKLLKLILLGHINKQIKIREATSQMLYIKSAKNSKKIIFIFCKNDWKHKEY
jgi:DNA-binding transcriptional regulator YiaG